MPQPLSETHPLPAPSETTQTEVAADRLMDALEALPDAALMAVVETLDAGELEAAREALRRSSGPTTPGRDRSH